MEELLECPASKLEALSDKDLEALLLPYFPKTRPELVAREKPKAVEKPKTQEELTKIAKRKRAEELMARMGIKLNL
jgi:hypothetical protein